MNLIRIGDRIINLDLVGAIEYTKEGEVIFRYPVYNPQSGTMYEERFVGYEAQAIATHFAGEAQVIR